MKEAYSRLKGLIGQSTMGRLNFIDEDIRSLGVLPVLYEIDSPRGLDRHLVASFDYENHCEVWLTANYDTYEEYPSGNNNASGVVTLLGLVEYIKENKLPVNTRVVFFDAGLDTDLISRGRRNPDFVPGSELYLQYLMNNDIDFIDSFSGAIVVQAVGKGNLSIFVKTGKKNQNSMELNQMLVANGDRINMFVETYPQSPNADNLSFLKEGLGATVLARYHEGSWHRMQTRGDDLTNVNVQALNETVLFLSRFLGSFKIGGE